MTRPPGWNHTDEAKQKISAKTQEARRKARELGLPERRTCTTCSARAGRAVFKPIKEFPWRKVKLVNGEVAWHPYPRCRECERERMREYRARLGQEEMRRRDKRWHQNRKRRRKREKILQRRVDKQPFLDFFDKWLALSETSDERVICARAGVSDKALYRVRYEQNNISLWLVDAILTSIGYPDQLFVLYPDVE